MRLSAGRAEDYRLDRIRQLNSPWAAVAEIAHHRAGVMVQVHDNLPDPVEAEPNHNPLQRRMPGNREHRFRRVQSVAPDRVPSPAARTMAFIVSFYGVLPSGK